MISVPGLPVGVQRSSVYGHGAQGPRGFEPGCFVGSGELQGVVGNCRGDCFRLAVCVSKAVAAVAAGIGALAAMKITLALL